MKDDTHRNRTLQDMTGTRQAPPARIGPHAGSARPPVAMSRTTPHHHDTDHAVDCTTDSLTARTNARGFKVDLNVTRGEVLRFVMGRPGSRVSATRLVYHTGEILLPDGSRHWCVIEQDQDEGCCTSIGVCLPAPGEGRHQLVFTHEPTFIEQAERACHGHPWDTYRYRYLKPPQEPDPEMDSGSGWSRDWNHFRG